MSNSRKSVAALTSTGTQMNVIGDALKGDSYLGYTDGLHTFQVIYDNFVGRLRVQGTLSLDPTEQDWFDILPEDTYGDAFNPQGYVQFNSNDPGNRSEAYTFRGNFTFLRLYVDRHHIGDGETYDPSYGQISRAILSA